MSAFTVFSGFGGSFQGLAQGETVILTVKGGAPTPLTDVIVLREKLQTRQTDQENRLQYILEVHIPIASYPAALPNVQGDRLKVAVRRGDSVLTDLPISAVLGQAGGMWHLGVG